MADKDLEHPFITLYCGHCGHALKIRLSCGSRVCPTCRKKWFGYHFKALSKIVGTWTVIHSLTLTIRNIPDREFGRYNVKEIRDYFSQLRSRFKQIEGGFYVVQATNSGSGWHLHLHVLFDGKFVPQSAISAAWKEITGGSYIVYLKDVKTPDKAIRYLLSDFSGRPRIRQSDEGIYDSVFKGSRLVQPFGKYRTVKLKVPFKCPDCGSEYWAMLEDLLGEKKVFHRVYDDG